MIKRVLNGKITSLNVPHVIVVLYDNYHILVNGFFKLHNAFGTIRRSLLLNCNCIITLILKVCNCCVQ